MSNVVPTQPGVDGADRRTPITGVVTMLDVLGWKGIYNRERDPITALEKLIRVLEGRGAPYRGRDDFSINIKSISDTVVIFSEVAAEAALEAIDAHGHICASGIVESIMARIPLRGATAYGEFEVRNNIYVGKAIDEAAAWYETSEWIGVHLTPSAACIVDSELTAWVRYPPPLKQSLKCDTFCVDWVRKWRQADSDGDPLKRLKSVFLTMGPIVPDLAPKFENTKLFLEGRMKDPLAAEETMKEVDR